MRPNDAAVLESAAPLFALHFKGAMDLTTAAHWPYILLYPRQRVQRCASVDKRAISRSNGI